ncbi:MAG: Threonyl-tRNA synthetase, partial [uncultured bacterium]
MKNVEDTFKINLYRHSMAHIMAYAIQNIFKDIKLGFGPPTENGFYYDFDLGEKKIELKDFPKIEEEMKKIIKNNFEYLRNELKHEDTLKDNWINKEPYKKIQVDKLHGEGVNSFSFYKTGEFLDLCEGPHIQNTSELSDIAFKLDRISGAYWLGSEKNKMLTRIYALCFMTQAELDEFLERRKKAEEWDHKKLGKELDIFMIDENIGKGLILWKPNGTVLREEIEKYAKEMEFKYGYHRVATPHIAKEKLFLQSGHLPAYQESMFPPIVVTEDNEVKDKFYLKPMNCPFHHTIFGS